jgi:hypothetical protein
MSKFVCTRILDARNVPKATGMPSEESNGRRTERVLGWNRLGICCRWNNSADYEEIKGARERRKLGETGEKTNRNAFKRVTECAYENNEANFMVVSVGTGRRQVGLEGRIPWPFRCVEGGGNRLGKRRRRSTIRMTMEQGDNSALEVGIILRRGGGAVWSWRNLRTTNMCGLDEFGRQKEDFLVQN